MRGSPTGIDRLASEISSSRLGWLGVRRGFGRKGPRQRSDGSGMSAGGSEDVQSAEGSKSEGALVQGNGWGLVGMSSHEDVRHVESADQVF